MSEGPKQEHKQENPSPRRNHQFRPSYKPRTNPGVSKAIHYFGVQDLRELLNKKHQEEQAKGSGPPPDPSYNYLKDPEREQEEKNARGRPDEVRQNYQKKPNNSDRQFSQKNINLQKQHPHSRAFHTDGNLEKRNDNTENTKPQTLPNLSRGRGRRPPKPLSRKESTGQIENPVNIKVQLTTNTGERSCTIDESITLPTIKHVPDHPNFVSHEKKFPGFRGRGRGRPRGRGGLGRFDNIKNVRPSTSANKTSSETEAITNTSVEGNKEDTVEEKLSQLNIDDEEDEDQYVEENNKFEGYVENLQGNVTVTDLDENNEIKRLVQVSANKDTEDGNPEGLDINDESESRPIQENKNNEDHAKLC